jgi:hypothetical protein
LIAKEEAMGELSEQLQAKEEQLKRTLGSKKVSGVAWCGVMWCGVV